MNPVFFALAAIAVGVAAWEGVPAIDGTVTGNSVVVAAPKGTVVTEGSEARVEAGGLTWHGRVVDVDVPSDKEKPTLVTVTTMAPVGPAAVRLHDLQRMKLVGSAAVSGAEGAVTLAIGLAGMMTLFLGLMRVLEKAGGLEFLARVIRPVMVRLFPDVPADHPAMGAMILNLSANILGLGNAATPFGIKAMEELATLSRTPGVATDAMVLFLAINTSGVAVLPTTMMATRASHGAQDPAAIVVPTLIATALNTVFAVLLTKAVARFFPPRGERARPVSTSLLDLLPAVTVAGALGGVIALVWILGDLAGAWILPMLVAGVLGVGFVRRVKVYEEFVEGAKEGFNASLRILPYLVGILTVVGMFRASGAMDLFVQGVGPLVSKVGVPPEVLPLVLLRPLSGSGSLGLATELTVSHGPNSLIALMAGSMYGSTETTFYVLAVYFGAVGITRIRHALVVGLAAEIVGMLTAVAVCRAMWG